MRGFKVELGGFKPWMWMGSGDLSPLQRSWTQQPGHYTLFFLEHDGVFSVNNRPISFRAGNVAFCVPGVKFGFDQVGVGTHQYHCVFEIVPRTENVIIPAVADLGADTDLRRREIIAAHEWLHVSIMRGLAFSFNLLWSIAQPCDSIPKSALVFELDQMIAERLGGKLSIPQLASELGISHGHLLRLFREEHSCTIQEYVREKRLEIACALIRNTDTPLKQIAAKVGIPDLQYFNKLIRAGTGLSPRGLREQAVLGTKH